MKKVVLLAGVIAAGMAAAPTAANAAAPADKQIAKAPLWASPSQDAFIASVQAKQTEYEAVMNKVKSGELYPDLAPAVRENFVNQLNNLIYGKFLSSSDRRGNGGVKPATLQQLIERAPYVGAFSYGDWESLTGKEFNDVVIALDNVKAAAEAANEVAKSGAATDEAYKEVLKNILGDEVALRPTTGITPESKKTELDGIAADAHTEYVDALTQIEGATDIDATKYQDLLDEIKEYNEKVKKYNEEYDKAKGAAAETIKAQNAAAAASVNHVDLDAVLEEALDILGAYDEKYQDPAGDKSDIYDATIYGGKDGAINTKFDATVKGQIQAAIDLIYSINHAGEIDDELISAFELQNDVNTIADLLEGSVITFKIEANHVAADNVKDALTEELGKLKHHQNCGHTDTHNVADEIQATIDQLDPDAAWDAKTDLFDRALTNPKAVLAWEAHLNGTSIAEVTGLYKKALGWDVTDLNEAILAFEKPWKDLDDSDVKTYLKSFFYTGKTITGTVANEYAQLKADIEALGATVTPAQFAALDQRVTNLYDRLANIEKAWDDIVKLCKDDHDLQKEINDAKTKDGYTSTTIKNKWETGEQPELDTLEGQITDAILAITKDAEFVGYNHFKPTVDLEKDHHKWLADYQKANWDAYQTMLSEIAVREAEYKAAYDYTIDTDQASAPNALGVYTTTENKGKKLGEIKGEKEPTKVIYASFGDNLGFTHIDGHFTDHTGLLATAPTHNGWEADLKNQRIDKWYNDADAEYIGAKIYKEGWADAAHLGKLKDNTVAGLDVATTATDASAILVNEPAAKENVVFGWLQKEIHTTFAKAIENEKANKDIHDKVQEAKDYIAAAKAEINNHAIIEINTGDETAKTFDVYDINTRLATSYTAQLPTGWDNEVDEHGAPTGLMGNVTVDPLTADYVKEGVVAAANAATVNYDNVFDCGHETGIWGWNKIAQVMSDLEDLEKKEYDKVKSLALLDGTTQMDLDADGEQETFEETLTEVKENVDDITNEAFTQLYVNTLAQVKDALDKAKAWAAALDGVCDTEDSLKPCSEEDVKNNPCGWDDPDASAALKAIVDAWNDELKLVTKTDHDTEDNDTHVDESGNVVSGRVVDVKEYAISALNAIYAWQELFAAADKKHKIALNEAHDLAESEAHAVHHYSYDAKLAMVNFTDADAAAASVWAADFNERVIGTFDGEEVTFQQFVKKIDDKFVAEYGDVHVMNPDVYAAIKAIAANGINSFADYVTATENLEKFIEDVAQVYFDHHQYTELKKLAEGAKNFNWEADFNKKIEANKDAFMSEVTLIEGLASILEAIELGEEELYGDATNNEYTGSETEHLVNYKNFVTELENIGKDIEDFLKEASVKHINGVADEYFVDTTKNGFQFKGGAINAAIEVVKADLAAAKKLYAENAAAKNRLDLELAAVVEANGLVVVDLNNTEMYDAEKAVITNADPTKPGLEEKFLAAVAVEQGVPGVSLGHFATEFYAGTLAANEGEEMKHVKALIDQNAAIADAILKAQKHYADNVAAKAELEGLFADKKEQLGEIVVTLGNLGDTVYESAADDLYKAVLDLQSDGEENFVDFADFDRDLAAQFAAGTLDDNADDFKDLLLDLQDGLDAIKGDIADAVQHKADNVAKQKDLVNELSNLLVLVEHVADHAEMYADDAAEVEYLLNNADITAETPKEGMHAKLGLIVSIKNTIENVKAECNDGTLDDNYANYADAVNGALAAHKQDLDALKDIVAEYEKLYADNVAARTALYEDLKNAEVLLESIMVDAYKVYGDDFNALDGMVQAIRDLIDKEPANIEKAFGKKEATDYVINAEIASKITNLQTAVKDYEEFLRDNRAKAVELTGELNDLLVILDGMHKYGDVYPEDKLIIDYLLDNDDILTDRPEGVKAAVLGLVERVKAEVANVDQDLTDGLVQANYENYKAAIENLKADINDLKQVIAEAETLYAENLRALNNLEEHAQAVKTAINTVKAQSACSECDALDMAELEKLLNGYDDAEGNHVDGVYDIEDDFNESFNVDKNLNEADVYMDYTDKLDQIETALAGIKAEIALHLDRVQSDLRAYNVLQKALEDVELWLANVELEDGWENFAERNAHCSNPDVKYLNELTTDVDALKALIDQQHSHEGGHSCEEYKIDDMKAMKALIEDAKTLIAAIQANNAAYALINERYGELYNDALAAYKFWHQYYSEQTLTDPYRNWYTAYKGWIEDYEGEYEAGDYLDMLKFYFDDLYKHGNAANAWTVDAQGKELNTAATDKFAEYDANLAKDRNDLAHSEAVNHAAQVGLAITDYVALTEDAYTFDGMDDPFVAEVLAAWREEVTGEFGLVASLNWYKEQIELAYAEGVMEDAINIDEHNSALGIHQQLNGVAATLDQIKAEYVGLFEDAHHLTNGKTLYSDMEYVTIGFFRKANEGLGEQATEMFKVVEPHFDAVAGNIGIYDTNWLNVTEWDDVNNTPDNWFDDVPAAYERDERGYLVHQEGLGVIPAEIGVLGHGDKQNELTFTLNDEKGYEVVTLAAGKADITFKPGSLSVYDQYNNEWLTKHNVYIEVNVEAPVVEVEEADVTGSSNKLIVRLNAPIDLTYTINSLVAKTDKGEEFSYADRVINYAANTLEFDLPAGTESVELPEGFFTFRTGENSIARSAAMVVAVGGVQTSIDAIIAMGEKAEIFDLQGRRVKAESLLSGNAYVVNGQKVVVK